jgi:hypothetical protein
VKKLWGLCNVCLIVLIATAMHAQRADAEFGLNAIHSTSASNFDFTQTDHSPQSLSGGVYPSFSADFLIWHNLGVGGEVSWKATRGLYLGSAPYRPILYDINAVYGRKVGRFGFAAMAGIGAESVRFYQNFFNCNGFGQCTNFVSSNHFLGHIGGELRYYIYGPVFVAPEAHVYFIHNNLEFTSATATRYGVNIGFTFGR